MDSYCDNGLISMASDEFLAAYPPQQDLDDQGYYEWCLDQAAIAEDQDPGDAVAPF